MGKGLSEAAKRLGQRFAVCLCKLLVFDYDRQYLWECSETARPAQELVWVFRSLAMDGMHERILRLPYMQRPAGSNTSPSLMLDACRHVP